VSGLSLDVLHTFKAIGQYANNPPSNTWRLTVLNGAVPAITGAEDSKGQPISNGGSTGDTTVRLRGTATKYLEVEIFDGNSSTGKRVEADGNGIWMVELTGLTRTKHVFKAKALYGSGTESGEWTVNVDAPAFIVEDFKSYPVQFLEPGESMQGLHTKLTLITTIGVHGTVGVISSLRAMRAVLIAGYDPGTLKYSLALRHEIAKSATIKGRYEMHTNGRIQLEFLKNNLVISTIEFFEGINPQLDFERVVAPSNGQAFDTLRFVMTNVPSEHLNSLDIHTVAFRN